MRIIVDTKHACHLCISTTVISICNTALSTVERLSASRRVRYGRFDCTVMSNKKALKRQACFVCIA